jgi:hypothetical protein
MANLQVPIAHRRVTQSTNPIQPLFAEEHRCNEDFAHILVGSLALRLIYTALIHAGQTWKGDVILEVELTRRASLCEHPRHSHAARTATVAKNISR